MTALLQIGSSIVLGPGGAAFAVPGSGGGTTAVPTFSPAAGSYGSTQTVTLSCATPSSSIYYTTDGTTPTFPITGSTTLYSVALTVSITQTIKAIGVSTGNSNSSVGSAVYTIGGAAFDFYISPTGSNANNGTSQATPWAITALQSGSSHSAAIVSKRVGLMDGTYDISTLKSTVPGSDNEYPALHLPAGSSGNPTIVQAVNPRAAILLNNTSGVSTLPNSMIGQNSGGAGWWTIDGLVLNGQGINGSLMAIYGVSPTSPMPGVTIQNCEMFGVAGLGGGNNITAIFKQDTLNAVIQNNKFHDVTDTQADHGHAMTEYGSTGTLFTRNTVMNCDSGIDGKVADNLCVVSQNYFYNCPQVAIHGYDGDQDGGPAGGYRQNTICNNIFDSCGQAKGVDVNGVIAQIILWFNNTMYDSRSGSKTIVDLRCGVGNDPAPTPGTATNYNNIVASTAGSGGSGGMMAFSTGLITLSDYNDYFYSSNTSGWAFDETTQFSSIASWRTASSQDAHSFQSNPSFVSTITPGAGSAQFQLQGGSSCKGTGHVGGVSGGAALDIGAWDGIVTQIGCDF